MTLNENGYEIEQWGRFEYRCTGPQEGNPFTDVRLVGRFRYDHRIVDAEGFYDGDGQYCIRFMPDTLGLWTFETVSNCEALHGHTGTLRCQEPLPGNRGPVRVHDTHHFAYADGTLYRPYGTTCYAWTHQGEQLEAMTLASLRQSPFNKIRMCVFPKHYDYNLNEPQRYPFAGSLEAGWDFTRFDPSYWSHLESRLQDLLDMGIEADLILFHPYDRWGFSKMTAETDELYLQYAIARLASFRNIWWSLANEYDLMHEKKMQDWDKFFKLIQAKDPYQHLRSIHNWHHPEIHYRSNAHWYDHGKPWVTHASIQHHDLNFIPEWRKLYGKPIVIDECRYEGDLNHGWGNLTAEAMTECFWRGMAFGGYVTHGETYVHPENIIWWSHGGTLHGQSAARIQFLQALMEEGPQLGQIAINFQWDTAAGGSDQEHYWVYFGQSRPAFRKLNLPEGIRFEMDLIDTWEMAVTRMQGLYEGVCRIELPAKPYMALRIRIASSNLQRGENV
ncbi:DUF5605 domain-containing protein [Paenibacillus aestuarii]|uniref:DUF5605 domain-containing protein n=1 Tax=Paenibacillus aestuarii TaxID=516965 RepID=A0ABW0KF20_9BACL|nr:DUF5605 domain-containing protein [Paenibacillus aestuarii]